MVSVKVFRSGERTGGVQAWVSIIWLTAMVNIGEIQTLKPWIDIQGVAQCGQNLTLLCHATLSDPGDIQLFTWLFNNMSCKYGESHADSEFVCQSGREVNLYTLNLTLLNLMPDDEGQYLCKIRSKAGVGSVSVDVRVQDCFEPSNFTMNETHATCCFKGVYPNGVILWSQEDVELTDFADPQEEKNDRDGRHACRTLDIRKGNLSQPYTCSLWSPKSGKNLFSQRNISVRKVSKGGTIGLRGDLPLVIMMSVIILTHLTS